MQCHLSPDCERDVLIRNFIPENEEFINAIDAELMDRFVKKIFGHENISKIRSAGNEPDEDFWIPSQYVQTKKVMRDSVSFRYKRIFDLCKVIGARHIYDIGCCYLNQSFYLSDYTRMTYTGIDYQFILNDYRKKDYDAQNIYYPFSETPPAPFCNNRIRFINAIYPIKIDAPSNNIAVSCYSITNTTNAYKIETMSEFFARDFDRVLFNTLHDSVDLWKKFAGKYFDFYPIGMDRFVFGTKIAEDVRRLKEMYPFENGRFDTGIDNYWEYDSMDTASGICLNYLNW